MNTLSIKPGSVSISAKWNTSSAEQEGGWVIRGRVLWAVVAALALLGLSTAVGIVAQRPIVCQPETDLGPAAPDATAGGARAVAVVSVAPTKVFQGGLLCVTVKGLSSDEGSAEGSSEGSSAPEVSVEVFGEKRRAFLSGDSARVFLPIDVKQTPGVYMADAACGDTGVIPAFFTVLRTDFPSSRITVTKETAQLTQDQARIRRDQALVRAAKSSTHPKPYWSESFFAPVKAPVSTPFGYIRYVNGQESGRHWGIDYAARAGTPVRTANAGRIVVAADLHLSGNTVVVDHGLNLFTSYLHMNDMTVKEGDLVEKGAIVGHVGSTGFSTGPHLHWSVTCGLDSFDPSALLLISP